MVKLRDGWISVKDRLPAKKINPDGSCNCVLIYAKEGFECGSDIQVVAVPWLLKHEDWGSLTHWRPLPEPPKEEQHGTAK